MHNFSTVARLLKHKKSNLKCSIKLFACLMVVNRSALADEMIQTGASTTRWFVSYPRNTTRLPDFWPGIFSNTHSYCRMSKPPHFFNILFQSGNMETKHHTRRTRWCNPSRVRELDSSQWCERSSWPVRFIYYYQKAKFTLFSQMFCRGIHLIADDGRTKCLRSQHAARWSIHTVCYEA